MFGQINELINSDNTETLGSQVDETDAITGQIEYVEGQ
jgi:hypothetical protein